ncbi:MAG: hypothetical protein ONB05_01440 [candidate division KSB1 bacterium]|nr:hypothetical protein [candidate division KSB1 bacterium]
MSLKLHRQRIPMYHIHPAVVHISIVHLPSLGSSGHNMGHKSLFISRPGAISQTIGQSTLGGGS